MKKLLMFAVCAMLAVAVCACGGQTAENGASDAVPDLSGAWKQTNSNSEESYQEATISGNTIEIYWVSDGGDTKSLYWAGSYEAPTAPGSYSWDSVNDHEKTDSAMLASGDDTKTFTYENGVLSYSASALGTTTTVEMEKQ